jgi:hypothetical protein
MKKCSKCGEEKELSEFYKGKKNKDGYMTYCKECRNKQIHKWELNNKEKIQKIRFEWYDNNKERRSEVNKKWYKNNKKRILEISKEWKENNPIKVKKHKAKRQRELGFNPLNKRFPGSVAHHTNRNDVVFIPEELHRSISHSVLNNQNMESINSVAINYLQEEFLSPSM